MKKEHRWCCSPLGLRRPFNNSQPRTPPARSSSWSSSSIMIMMIIMVIKWGLHLPRHHHDSLSNQVPTCQIIIIEIIIIAPLHDYHNSFDHCNQFSTCQVIIIVIFIVSMIVVIVIILHLTAIGWGFFHQRTLSILEWDLGFHSNPSLFPPLWFSFCHLPRERADAFVKAFSPFLQSDNPFKGSLFWVMPEPKSSSNLHFSQRLETNSQDSIIY